MKHNLKISVSKNPNDDGVLACKNVTVREKILRLLFGVPKKITVLVPGDTVQEICISDVKEGDESDESEHT